MQVIRPSSIAGFRGQGIHGPNLSGTASRSVRLKTAAPIIAAGRADSLISVIASNKYPLENLTLSGLFEYAKGHYPRMLKGGKTDDEKLAIFCLAIANEADGSFCSKARDRIRKCMAKISGPQQKVEALNALEAEAYSTLPRLENVILPAGSRTAFAIAQYFGDAYNDGDLERFSDEGIARIETTKSLFDLCLHPKKRIFVGRWERDHSKRLSSMSAKELQAEWVRVRSLREKGIAKPLYTLSLPEFIGDTMQDIYPYICVSEDVLKNIPLDNIRQMCIYSVAMTDIYLEWAARHWALEPLKHGIRSIPATITPSLDHIKRIITLNRPQNVTPEETTPYRAFQSITEQDAIRVLGL